MDGQQPLTLEDGGPVASSPMGTQHQKWIYQEVNPVLGYSSVAECSLSMSESLHAICHTTEKLIKVNIKT
jgi:hypothetical protein